MARLLDAAEELGGPAEFKPALAPLARFQSLHDWNLGHVFIVAILVLVVALEHRSARSTSSTEQAGWRLAIACLTWKAKALRMHVRK